VKERLWETALTPGQNERLELLGDAVLGMVVAAELYRRRPDWSESEIALGREQIVSGRTLAEAGRRAGIDRQIRGKPPPGGWPDSVVADVVEALVAAAYLDGGLDAARVYVLQLLGPELRQVLTGQHLRPHPKNELQTVGERVWGERPKYEVVEASEATGVRVRVCVGPVKAEGHGRTRREAEVAAAQSALEALACLRSGSNPGARDGPGTPPADPAVPAVQP